MLSEADTRAKLIDPKLYDAGFPFSVLEAGVARSPDPSRRWGLFLLTLLPVPVIFLEEHHGG